MRNPYDSLNTASRILGFAAFVLAIVGIIGGTFFATIGERSDDSTPYLVVGIGVVLYNLIFAAILYGMSSFGMAWANKNDPIA